MNVTELTVRITQTVSAYSYIYLDKFLEWAPNRGYELCL